MKGVTGPVPYSGGTALLNYKFNRLARSCRKALWSKSAAMGILNLT